MTPILILAAGQSSRMRGRDKLLEPVDGLPLLTAQARKALAVTREVFVALPAPDHPRLAALTGLAVTPLFIPDAASGMAVSLRGAVAELPAFERVLILLADLPEITADDLRTVILAGADDSHHLIWRGATVDGRPGHPILFDGSLRGHFATLSGDTGGQSIVAQHKARTRLVPLPGQNALCDLDTPGEWARWRQRTGR